MSAVRKNLRAPEARSTLLTDEIYAKIRELIMSYDITPGSRINIDALSIKLKVSQTPIREALARLESEDLIAKVPLKGYRATALLSPKEFHDLFQFRLLIEPWAAEQAAKLIDSTGIKAIKSEISTTKKALKIKNIDEFRSLTEHDSRFHALICELSGNLSVSAAFARTHCHLHLFRLFIASRFKLIDDNSRSDFVQNLFAQYYQNGAGQLAIVEHEVIAQAIIAHDTKAARLGMYAHIQSSLNRFSSREH